MNKKTNLMLFSTISLFTALNLMGSNSENLDPHIIQKDITSSMALKHSVNYHLNQSRLPRAVIQKAILLNASPDSTFFYNFNLSPKKNYEHYATKKIEFTKNYNNEFNNLNILAKAFIISDQLLGLIQFIHTYNIAKIANTKQDRYICFSKLFNQPKNAPIISAQGQSIPSLKIKDILAEDSLKNIDTADRALIGAFDTQEKKPISAFRDEYDQTTEEICNSYIIMRYNNFKQGDISPSLKELD